MISEPRTTSAGSFSEFDRENSMPPLEHLQPIVALIAGVLILIIPRLLNIIVAVYLIVVGLIGLGFLR
jgi:hypothetical protein